MGSIQNPTVYVVDPYHDAAITKLKEQASINLVPHDDPRKKDFLDHATAVLVRSETTINAESIRRAHSGLKYIVKQGVGVDNIDIFAAQEKGVQVFNTPGLNGEAVAELTIALAMCVARRVCEFDRRIRNGEKVIRSQMLGKSLFGKTLGVIGMGNIGLEVAKKWRAAMDGHVVAYDPYSKEGAWSNEFATGFRRVDRLDAVLEAAEVLTLHVPLTKGTLNLLSSREFELMPEGAILLNCARGGVVDEAALLESLSAGHLYGAGLDAMQYEPPTLSAYGSTLLSHPRVVMTPHVGASTAENQERSGMAAVDIVIALLNGDVANIPKPLV
jgi:D-3-phosphoglycerate dehydrogenase